MKILRVIAKKRRVPNLLKEKISNILAITANPTSRIILKLNNFPSIQTAS